MIDHIPPLNPICVSCIFKKQMERYPVDAPREQVMAYLRRLGALLAELPECGSGPMLLEMIAEVRREVFGAAGAAMEPDYTALKRQYNALMMDMVAKEGISDRVRGAEDPVRVALGYAMIGNYIDFGALDSVAEDELRALLARAETEVSPQDTVYQDMATSLMAGRRLVYLTDNGGEIVMDKLLIELLRELYPGLAITVIVRGAPVLNDATVEDARQVGLDTIPGVRLMGNGDNIAGTALGRISEEARAALYGADVILAKGMANFETMQGCRLPVYYAFLCKCPMFADRFGVPLYSGMLVREAGEIS